MKRTRIKMFAGFAALGIFAAVWAAGQIGTTASQTLARWMPGGALFYLESSDFATQLRDWNRSGVEAKWLSSKNHEQFITTRLALKLKDVYDEFSNAAGFAPDLNALETIAGSESALAVYDIGQLDLVYVSKLPAARLSENVLARVRTGYQSRSVGTQAYFVRQSGNRTAAFAVAGDYVVVSTREDLLVQALGLIQGNAGAGSISDEAWYQDAVRAMGSQAAAPAALRLVMDLPSVMKTPYFGSYWIQRNAADLAPYSTFLSQVERKAGVLEESRVLVRRDQTPVAAHEAAAVELQRFIPDGVGLYRLWDSPSVDFAMNLIREKFFAAGSRAPAARQTAPALSAESPVGFEGDLQTRIDEPPKPSLAGELALDPLRKLVESAGLEAILHLESSVSADDPTYVRTDAAVALRSSSPWNPAELQQALTAAAASYQSVSDIGLQWRNVSSGNLTFSQWNGLTPLTVYADGQTLWIARTPSLLAAALNRRAGSSPQPGVYFAGYSHRSELQPYLRMTRMLDLSDQQNYSNFFSENIGSLASSLDVIQSVSLRTTDDGSVQRQLVRYQVSP